MGMGYGANFVDTVTEEFVEEVAGAELENFKQALENIEVEISTFAQEAEFDQDEYGDEVDQSYDALVKKFEAVTGLGLDIGYHNQEDEGDRYDDIDGVYWSVGGVYQPTDAGLKYGAKISRAFFVNFG